MEPADLYRKIRYAEEPDNGRLVSEFLRAHPATRDQSPQQRRLQLHAQYRLLMETIADECLSSAWRQQCLEQIYRPLAELWHMAHTRSSRQEVLAMYAELRVVGDYVTPSIQCN